ncbi:pyrroline-5-carboxylate reductase [Sporosarcina sp. G11-34]|uniref:pyrroline-5-carboxylate reductase n=1 Tax=Sporosarcina sp. G11-34 TaxID=2849605 RepID=UPI0022A9CEB8|nr:pyrroline-5-carboxylate reductase [Sporosarcina sp. G11-34]MCZ2260143.1 pyrroline-5-carboxylate reductase [Sporosarcina sp. G11-34]
METIVFVGAGSMAEAMIGGIVKQGAMEPKNVFVINKSDDARLQSLKDKYGISTVRANKEALKKMDLVIFATKPKDIHQAMADMLPFLADHTAALSVIAGVSIQTIEEGLGNRPIARAMPNTSATIGKSATAVAWNESVESHTKELVLGLLNAIGMVKEVEEDELHAVTALSGSGPAYVYYLAEALEEAATRQGLSKETSRALIIQTFEGAAAMMKKIGAEPTELRKHVTSPGGTTEAGITALENQSFKEIIMDCINKAEARSRELGRLD